jgi:hypothetical protein
MVGSSPAPILNALLNAPPLMVREAEVTLFEKCISPI